MCHPDASQDFKYIVDLAKLMHSTKKLQDESRFICNLSNSKNVEIILTTNSAKSYACDTASANALHINNRIMMIMEVMVPHSQS